MKSHLFVDIKVASNHRKSVNFDRFNFYANNHKNYHRNDLSNLNRKSEMFPNRNKVMYFLRDPNRLSINDRIIPWIGKTND